MTEERTSGVRCGRRRDRAAAGAALGAAFQADPFVEWLVPDETRRRARWAGGMVQQFAFHHRQDAAWVVDGDDGVVAGAALWSPPGRWRIPPVEQARAAPRFAWVIGARALPRAARCFVEVERHHPDEPHWYLAVLGVRPADQGRGLGAALLTPVLDRCDVQGTPAYLETAEEANLAFYARHGFAVREELDVTVGGPRLWTMWREPRIPAD